MKSIFAIFWLVVIGSVAAINPTLAAQTEPAWWVSAPELKVGRAERVIGFELDATNGFIGSVAHIPAGWYISIRNDESGAAAIWGNIQVGAAAVGTDFFRRFVAIQQNDPKQPISDVRLEVVVTSDFNHDRHIEVPQDQIVLSSPAVGTNLSPADQPETVWWVSTPTLNGDHQARVIAFDLKANDSSIRAMANIPKGWYISITNDGSGAAEVAANIQAGAAAVGTDYFRKPLAIRQNDPKAPISDVRLNVTIASGVRNVAVLPGQLELTTERN